MSQRYGRFACGTEVRADDALGPVVVDNVFGRPDDFSLAFTYPGHGFGGSVQAAQVYTREQFIARRTAAGQTAAPRPVPDEPDNWWE